MLLDPEGTILDRDEEFFESPDREMNDSGSEIDVGDFEYHKGGSRPSHEIFDTLSLAMARAMKQMPKLRKFLYRMDDLDTVILSSETCWYGFSCFHISHGDVLEECHSPTTDSYSSIADESKTRIDWIFTCTAAELQGWQIPDKAKDMLHGRWGDRLDIGIITHKGNKEEEPWVRSSSIDTEVSNQYIWDFFGGVWEIFSEHFL